MKTISRTILRLFAALGLLGGMAMATAMTLFPQDFTCPIGGEKFRQTLMGSGTAFGRYLDLRPYGAIEAPWPLPQCPGNGFVMFKDEFSAQELEQLAQVVESDTYRRLRQTDTSYFLAAHLMAALHADHRQLAYTLLSASWQGNEEQARRYQALVLAHLEQQAAPPADPELALTDQLLAGEMERRLGRFEAARRRFEAVKQSTLPRSASTERLIAFQLQLIAAQDSRDHQAPQAKDAEPAPPPTPSRRH